MIKWHSFYLVIIFIQYMIHSISWFLITTFINLTIFYYNIRTRTHSSIWETLLIMYHMSYYWYWDSIIYSWWYLFTNFTTKRKSILFYCYYSDYKFTSSNSSSSYTRSSLSREYELSSTTSFKIQWNSDKESSYNP